VHASYPTYNEHQFFFGAIVKMLSLLFGKSAFAFGVLGIFLLYLQAMLLYQVASQFRLYIQNSYLVSFSFIVLSSLHPSFSSFNPFLIVNLLVVLVFSEILKLKSTKNTNKHFFNIGALLMVAMLIHFSILMIIPFVFLSLLLLRKFDFKEWIILKLGLLTPIYFLATILFCFDSLSLFRQWPTMGISFSKVIAAPVYFFGLVFGLFVWGALAVITMQSQLPKAPIYIRRTWISITFLFLGTFLSVIFTKSQIPSIWIICLPVLSFILTQAFLNQRTAKINLISFYFALALVLFCQIFFPF
jgi:hypothetical protein